MFESARGVVGIEIGEADAAARVFLHLRIEAARYRVEALSSGSASRMW